MLIRSMSDFVFGPVSSFEYFTSRQVSLELRLPGTLFLQDKCIFSYFPDGDLLVLLDLPFHDLFVDLRLHCLVLVQQELVVDLGLVALYWLWF